MLQSQHEEKGVGGHASSSSIEVILNRLSKLEEEIDAIAKSVEDYKKSLNAMVDREIEALREKVIMLANEESERIVSLARSEAEDESRRILAEGEKVLNAINDNIAKNTDKAVTLILERMLQL